MLEAWQVQAMGSGRRDINECIASSLLVFPEPHSELLLCVISKYDDDDFLRFVYVAYLSLDVLMY